MGSYYEDTLAEAADAVFLLPNKEWVTYIPASGSQRRVEALVERYEENDSLDGFAGGSRPSPVILVKNNSTSGISSDEIDTGGDKIELALREGSKPVQARIIELLSHDAGFCRIQVQ